MLWLLIYCCLYISFPKDLFSPCRWREVFTYYIIELFIFRKWFLPHWVQAPNLEHQTVLNHGTELYQQNVFWYKGLYLFETLSICSPRILLTSNNRKIQKDETPASDNEGMSFGKLVKFEFGTLNSVFGPSLTFGLSLHMVYLIWVDT